MEFFQENHTGRAVVVTNESYYFYQEAYEFSIEVECPVCNGSGEVEASNSEGYTRDVTCPHCGGDGEIETYICVDDLEVEEDVEDEQVLYPYADNNLDYSRRRVNDGINRDEEVRLQALINRFTQRDGYQEMVEKAIKAREEEERVKKQVMEARDKLAHLYELLKDVKTDEEMKSILGKLSLIAS